MTVQQATTRVSFACNGVTTAFAVNIQAYQATDFVVTLTTAAGVETTLTLNGDYSLVQSGTLSPTYWTLNCLDPVVWPVGDTLQVFLNPVQSQQTQYVQGQAFPSAAVQANFDRLTQMVLRLQDQINRSIRAPDGDVSPAMLLPIASTRAGGAAIFDSNGNLALGVPVTGTITAALIASLLNTVTTYPVIYSLNQTASEQAVGVTPLNFSYPEGALLRYLVSFTAGVTDCTAALNNATKVCAYGKATLQLPAAPPTAPILISGTWDCSAKYTGVFAYPNNTNGGLKVVGQGKIASVIQYIAGANNTGVAWDRTGLAYGFFASFAFIGGSSTSNCPLVTLLDGAANVSGFVFAGNNVHLDCDIEGYGDNVWYNAGAEAQDFIDCTLIGWRNNTFPNAQPIVFVASGSTPTVTSALQTTNSPVQSMTLIRWYGAKAAMILNGLHGIVFHFTTNTAGACADIRFDDWFQVKTPSGAFQFMADDSSGFAGTGLFNCGGERMIMEIATTNTNISVGNFSVALPKGLKFEGHAGSQYAVSQYPVVFNSTAVPTNVTVDWDPNESGAFTAAALVFVSGTENGIHVRGPLPSANLIIVGSSRTIDGYPGYGWSGEGTDYGNVLSTYLAMGPAVDGQFNRVRKLKAGTRVTSNSDGNEGVQTTQGVTTGATTILAMPNLANIAYVTGAGAGGRFFDMVKCMNGGATAQVINSDATGSPAARTYSISSGNLQLAMASGTYAVQATCLGIGMQT